MYMACTSRTIGGGGQKRKQLQFWETLQTLTTDGFVISERMKMRNHPWVIAGLTPLLPQFKETLTVALAKKKITAELISVRFL